MKKSILIIGAGPGLSQGVANKFAKEGFSIALISRNAANLENIKQELSAKGVREVSYTIANAGNAKELGEAISKLAIQVNGFDVVLYNAAVVKAKDIMEESTEVLTHDFTINVANALHSLQVAYPGLKEKQGAFLLTGGGLGITPDAGYGSLSIGKAGLRSLAYQLHDRLKNENIYVGLLTVAGYINEQSATHSPDLLANLFWKLYEERAVAEIQQ
jgi:short-subunit dehydrogenase